MPLKTKHKIAIARCLRAPFVAVRKITGQTSKLTARRQRITWNLDLDEGIDLAIFLFGSFESDTAAALRRLVKPGSTVLDIGANFGAHTLPLALLVGDKGRVFAFEPTDYAFAKLNTNLDLNPKLKERVTTKQAFLTAETELAVPAAIYSSWPLTNVAQLHPKHFGSLQETKGASALILDRFLGENGVERIDLIKMDVDGHEVKVLNGAHKLLSKDRPTIVMELAPYALAETGSSLAELLEILKQFHYSLYDERSQAKLPIDAALLNDMIPDGAGINVVAAPSKDSIA